MDKLNKKKYHIKLSKRSPEGADRTINVLLTNILCQINFQNEDREYPS